MFGAVELLSYQSSIPGENGVWLGDAGHLLQQFSAEPLTDLGERRFLWIGQPQPVRQVGSQDSVLCCQILVLQEQLLVD